MVNFFTQRDNTQPATVKPVLFPPSVFFSGWSIPILPLQWAMERKNANNCGDIALTMELLALYKWWNVDLVMFSLIPGALYFERNKLK